MSEEKTQCRECTRAILVSTAKRTGGLCVPCQRKASPVTFEITPEDERRFQAIQEIVERLLRAPSDEELSAARCPACDSPLVLRVHPRKKTFFLRCAASSLHVGLHRTAEFLPSWMDQYVSGGWLEEEPNQAAQTTPGLTFDVRRKIYGSRH